MSKANQHYPEQRLAGLRLSTSARKRETVERLHEAIESIKNKKQAITAQTIYVECGLSYASYARNPEALALFRANSTHLNQKRQRSKRKRKIDDALTPSRDPLMNYKKPQLVSRLREMQQQLQRQERQLAVLADGCLQRDARVAELEARLAELEPYRDFVEQIRQRIQREEYRNDTPPSS